MIFPGNQLLLNIPGVQVLATAEARSHVENSLNKELHWFRHGPDYIERVMRANYPNDPLVMSLLDLYLAVAPDEATRSPITEDNRLKPWPKN